MTLKHTPGPWTVELGDSTMASEVWSANGQIICDVHSHVSSREHADALLIAAAPELLEALIHCSTDEGPEQEWLNKARAAIQKAQGGAA